MAHHPMVPTSRSETMLTVGSEGFERASMPTVCEQRDRQKELKKEKEKERRERRERERER